MRKLIIALAMIMATAATVTVAGQTHKRQSATVKVQVKNDTASIVAYSDTTGSANTAAVDSADSDEDVDPDFGLNASDITDPFQMIAYLADSNSPGAVLIGVCTLCVGLLFMLSPFILTALIVYFVLRNRRMKYKLIEKSLENGQPLPKQLAPDEAQDDDTLQRRGIKNAAVGIGLAVMFYCFGMTSIAGVGWLVFFYGAGQVAIAYISSRKKKKNVGDIDAFAEEENEETTQE